jgi:hypothetical protein
MNPAASARTNVPKGSSLIPENSVSRTTEKAPNAGQRLRQVIAATDTSGAFSVSGNMVCKSGDKTRKQG